MRSPLLPPILLLTAVLALMLAGSALAARPKHVGPVTRAALRADRECVRTGKVTHRHSVHVLTVALRLLPADVKRYTNCPAVLRAARVRARGRSRIGGS